jgi:hypothetical protein
LPLSYFRPNADYSTHADNGLIANLFPVFVQIAKSVEAIFPPVRSSTVAFYRAFEDEKNEVFHRCRDLNVIQFSRLSFVLYHLFCPFRIFSQK